MDNLPDTFNSLAFANFIDFNLEFPESDTFARKDIFKTIIQQSVTVVFSGDYVHGNEGSANESSIRPEMTETLGLDGPFAGSVDNDRRIFPALLPCSADGFCSTRLSPAINGHTNVDMIIYPFLNPPMLHLNNQKCFNRIINTGKTKFFSRCRIGRTICHIRNNYSPETAQQELLSIKNNSSWLG